MDYSTLKKILTYIFIPVISLLAILNTAQAKENQVATLAGGCFWCTESDLEQLPGVLTVVSGYSGGETTNPSYKDVSSGKSGHIEVIEVTFDSNVVSYEQVLDYFFRHIDPTDDKGSFVDRGPQYRPAIFYHNEQQKMIAANFMQQIDLANIFPKKLKTELIAFNKFWPAEEYHQDYYKKSKLRYKYYRYASGRDKYLDKVFGSDRKTNPVTLRQLIDAKTQASTTTTEEFTVSLSTKGFDSRNFVKPSDAQLEQRLTSLQYKVTQHEGTERPFDNKYWDNKAAGIYVDIVSGEPLFSSIDKYRSGTGWPSFTKPIDTTFITTKADRSLFFSRTEVRSKFADSHLGHVFDDGPKPTGLRYCMNSAAMRFIAKEDLSKEGYADYLTLFN